MYVLNSVDILNTGSTERSKYGVIICIKTKRQYKHCHQLGKQSHRVIWDQIV